MIQLLLLHGEDGDMCFKLWHCLLASFSALEGLVTSLSTVTEEKHGAVKVLATCNSRATEEDTSDMCLYFEVPDAAYQSKCRCFLDIVTWDVKEKESKKCYPSISERYYPANMKYSSRSENKYNVCHCSTVFPTPPKKTNSW